MTSAPRNVEPRVPFAAGFGDPAPHGWMVATGLVAATYVYFLLFSEFAFLELVLRSVGTGTRSILACLGTGGVAGAVLGASLYRPARAATLMRWSFLLCAFSALLAIAVRAPLALGTAAAASGLGLGAATVALASALAQLAGRRRLGWAIGCGTGLAYGVANLPGIFTAGPELQAGIAAAAVVMGAALTWWIPDWGPPGSGVAGLPKAIPSGVTSARWITVLLALVWLDSAVFYIIQHNPALKVATWGSPSTLWLNAAVHLVAAALAGWLLDRGFRTMVVAGALLALAGAAAVLRAPGAADLGVHWFYTAGVSLYSVALVELPARTGRPATAAAVFGIAGWAGSALGIGMAQDLAGIPPAFIIAAMGIGGMALISLRRGAALLGLVLVIGTSRGAESPRNAADEVAVGREVYIAEGCLHCHSQYVRPKVPLEVLNWGPATTLEETLAGRPPLFGTRRQGPDLARVGNRRSLEWNRIHLIDPRAVSPGSRMPSYAHLFARGDPRGEALLAYLQSLGAATLGERVAAIAKWKPEAKQAIPPGSAAALFRRQCASCHGESGAGDGPLALRLSIKPPDWRRDAWRHAPDAPTREETLCRIIKFGVPGLPMAGHETLPDEEILGLARHVIALHK